MKEKTTKSNHFDVNKAFDIRVLQYGDFVERDLITFDCNSHGKFPLEF